MKLYNYLMNTEETEIVMLTTRAGECWDDVQFDAKCAGYTVTRYNDEKLVKAHKFSEVYKFEKIKRG